MSARSREVPRTRTLVERADLGGLEVLPHADDGAVGLVQALLLQRVPVAAVEADGLVDVVLHLFDVDDVVVDGGHLLSQSREGPGERHSEAAQPDDVDQHDIQRVTGERTLIRDGEVDNAVN